MTLERNSVGSPPGKDDDAKLKLWCPRCAGTSSVTVLELRGVFKAVVSCLSCSHQWEAVVA